jgi:diacylglycerol O-acyltransferase / wax synthase
MERLSGLDASFLYLETPTLHMHVSMAAVFDPSTVKGGFSFERVRKLVSRRLVQVPIFRRRLVEVPFRLGHPYWVDDPNFDIDFHLRRAALPSPGGLKELGEFVGDVCSRPLDRTKPLWQMYIVEGLENGNFALVTKIHHSTVDGVSGAELLGKLFDLSVDPVSDIGEDEPTTRRGIPTDAQLVVQALLTRLTKPPRVARLAWRTAFAFANVRKVRGSDSTGKGALPLTAPRTSFNAAITSHRKVAFSSISLDDVKALKNLMGVTVNDVVLAIAAGALRTYLQDGDELPDIPLVASVPVAVQDIKGVTGSNRVSAMFVSLPTNVEDPLDRIRTINHGTRGAKEEQKALGADVLLNWVEHATPNLFAAAARTYSRLKLADHHRPIHNLIISNVPGPDFPLYFAGAELVAGFPLGPVLEGAGLNMTVMSYRGVLNWGLMCCRETVPGADLMAAAIPAALDELLLAAGLPPGTPVGVAPGPGPARVAAPAEPKPASRHPKPHADVPSPADADPAAGTRVPPMSITDVSVADMLVTDPSVIDVVSIPGSTNGVGDREPQ